MKQEYKNTNKVEAEQITFEVDTCEVCGTLCPIDFMSYTEDGLGICPNCYNEAIADTGIGIIASERQKLISQHGFSFDDDVLNPKKDDLAIAASCYCLPSGQREFRVREQWPLNYELWDPTPEDRVKELAKAGALIAAEIDRIKTADFFGEIN